MKTVLIRLIAFMLCNVCLAELTDIEKKLQETVISEIEFNKVTMREAVAYLNDNIKWNTNSVIGLDPTIQKSTNTIMFTARGISALQAIRIIASISDIHIHCFLDHVMFSPFCCPEATGKTLCPRLATVRYQSKDVIETLTQCRQNSFDMIEQPVKNLDEWAVLYLAKLGILWHAGSSLKIDTRAFIITIINAPEEFRKFESIMTETDSDQKTKLERLDDAQHPAGG